MSAAQRRMLRRARDKVYEDKRQQILASMDEEARAEHGDDDLATLICLRQTGRLNMLPNMEDLG